MLPINRNSPYYDVRNFRLRWDDLVDPLPGPSVNGNKGRPSTLHGTERKEPGCGAPASKRTVSGESPQEQQACTGPCGFLLRLFCTGGEPKPVEETVRHISVNSGSVVSRNRDTSQTPRKEDTGPSEKHGDRSPQSTEEDLVIIYDL